MWLVGSCWVYTENWKNPADLKLYLILVPKKLGKSAASAPQENIRTSKCVLHVSQFKICAYFLLGRGCRFLYKDTNAFCRESC